jgi:hypothetical protein
MMIKVTPRGDKEHLFTEARQPRNPVIIGSSNPAGKVPGAGVQIGPPSQEEIMSSVSQQHTDIPLYTYTIASGDMRYIEINQRNLFLRHDPNLGLILRGELPGCGAGCYADLSQVLLEYAMTCEGCKSPEEACEYVAGFARRLGELLAGQLATQYSTLPAEARLPAGIEVVLKSMLVPFTSQHSPQRLEYSLEYCPLCQSGSLSGMGRELVMARYGFAALCKNLAAFLAPAWKVVTPTQQDAEQELLSIILERSA